MRFQGRLVPTLADQEKDTIHNKKHTRAISVESVVSANMLH